MYQNDDKYTFYCKQYGHCNQIIESVCIYGDCERERKCCDRCIKNHNHSIIKLQSRYLMPQKVIRNFMSERDKFLFDWLTDKTEKEYTKILHEEIVKIAIPKRQIEEEKTLYFRQNFRLGWEIVLSNYQRFIALKYINKIVIMDLQNGLKVFRMQIFETWIHNVCFSPSDAYLYICTSNKLIQLKISKNSQTFVEGIYLDNTALFCVSETEILLCLNNRIEIFDFKKKQQKQIVQVGLSIISIAFQAVSKHFACLISWRIIIYDTSGKFKCTFDFQDRKADECQKIQFFENKDILLQVDKLYLIIWQVDYTKQYLILQKIILCNDSNRIESSGLRGDKDQIYLLINGRIELYSLGDDKLQSFELRNNKEFQNISNVQNILVTKNKIYLIQRLKNMNRYSVRVIRNNQMII